MQEKIKEGEEKSTSQYIYLLIALNLILLSALFIYRMNYDTSFQQLVNTEINQSKYFGPVAHGLLTDTKDLIPIKVVTTHG